MLDLETKKKIEDAVDEIRPYLEADGGNVEIIEITDDLVVKIKLVGSCAECDMSYMTTKAGIEGAIRNRVPALDHVEQVK